MSPADPAAGESAPIADRRRWELGVFLAVVLIIIPGLTVATIGLYALIVWIFQMVLFGPPGPVY